MDLRFEQVDRRFEQVDHRFGEFDQKLGQSNQKFDTYQQATQWVVQLAFSLIASATVLVIITTVFKR
ncbi:MAG: hypothetical protein MUF49_30585 [Oculatellaceae cyanobacterium Prado106]|nr:hypothetical protein [Oculatellaceae cyanobacterium Prado106]